MTKTEETKQRVSEKKIQQSIKALLKLKNESKSENKKEDKNILENSQNENNIILIFSLMKMNEKTNVKPITIPLKHSIHPKDSPREMCLFVKDPQRDYKDLILELGLDKKITKVIGVSKLRQKYKEYEAKRLLCNSFDLFLADKRILPLLPKLLGKSFFAKKRLPVPIDVTKKSTLVSQIEDLESASLLHPNKGTCWALKVGRVSGMSGEEIGENVLCAIQHVVEKAIPKRWENVRGISIKSESSIALPLYDKLPEHPLAEDMRDAEEEAAVNAIEQ